MSLLERTQAVRPESRPANEPWSHYREPLQQALYRQMSAQRIAELAARDRPSARREVTAALELAANNSQFKGLVDGPGRAELIKEVTDLVLGLGPIEELLADEEVTEIMVNGPAAVFYEKAGKLHRSKVAFADEEQVRAVIDRIVAPLGRRVDEQSPIVNARLPSGHRVNVVVPPLALDGPVLTIRKFRAHAYDLAELVEMGTLSEPMRRLLAWAVRARCNIAVSGGTGGGKTTLLNALSDEIAPDERIITIEDSAELRFQHHPHVVRLEARPANAEGSGLVTIRDLVINSLRMRPDRIIVGECRGAEALDMLQAMNTGHDGSMTTLHANAAEEVIPRLVMMTRFGIELPVDVIEEQIASAIGLVVQQDRFPDGSRRITQLMELRDLRRTGKKTVGAKAAGVSGTAELVPLVKWDRDGKDWIWQGEPHWITHLETLGVATGEEVRAWREEVASLSPA